MPELIKIPTVVLFTTVSFALPGTTFVLQLDATFQFAPSAPCQNVCAVDGEVPEIHIAAMAASKHNPEGGALVPSVLLIMLFLHETNSMRTRGRLQAHA
jgi:hypothetical protein